jgi:hypothetical protein
MNLPQNEKGNTLLLVLLITVIFTTLGISIIAATMGGAKRTVVREEDIDATFEAIHVIDELTSELSMILKEMPISSVSPGTFKPENLLNNKIAEEGYNTTAVKGIKSVELNDITEIDPAYQSIDTAKSLTRVVEIIVTANTPATLGNIERTAKKRIIISPLPSFLKYAFGSEEGILQLNGSPHFEGNIFANTLQISKNANFVAETGENKFIESVLPSMTGDVYAGTYDLHEYKTDSFKPSDMLNLVNSPVNFYKGNTPDLKSDSQYQKINFENSFEYERDIKKLELNNTTYDSAAISAVNNPASGINSSSIPEEIQETSTNTERKLSLHNSGLNTPLSISATEKKSTSLTISNQDTKLSFRDISIDGDLTIVANQDITLNNVNVSGTLAINNNGGNLTINGNVVTNGPLMLNNESTMTLNGTIYANSTAAIQNTGTAIFQKINSIAALDINSNGNLTLHDVVAGNEGIELTNSGVMAVKSHLLSKNDMTITNNKDLTIESTAVPKKNLYAGNVLKLVDKGGATIHNHLYAKNRLQLELLSNSKITGNLFSERGSAELIVENAEAELKSTLFSEGELFIHGNGEKNYKENDTFLIDGVMYSNSATRITSLNIKKLGDGQLVLFTKRKLTITRINEFNNYTYPDEPEEDYLPLSSDSIQPIEGFFYSDSDADVAELYGVGSLFYIRGGVFAKGNLTVNAIRGTPANFDDLDTLSKKIRQDDSSSHCRTRDDQCQKYSRFIVDHDQDILLKNIDALPKVEYLSLYSDQLTVE